jgi:hypothetical protein
VSSVHIFLGYKVVLIAIRSFRKKSSAGAKRNCDHCGFITSFCFGSPQRYALSARLAYLIKKVVVSPDSILVDRLIGAVPGLCLGQIPPLFLPFIRSNQLRPWPEPLSFESFTFLGFTVY